MNRLMIALTGAALCVGACKKSEPADTGANAMAMNDTMAGDNMAANDMTAVAPTSAQGIANAAAASDHFEIGSSKLADTAAKSPAVKAFARQMITAHTASTAKLKGILAGMSPPMTADDTLNADQQATMTALQGKTGADFDTAYAAAQVDAHQKTLDALKAYASSGDNPKLRDFAKQLIPTVTAHLNMAKDLK